MENTEILDILKNIPTIRDIGTFTDYHPFDEHYNVMYFDTTNNQLLLNNKCFGKDLQELYDSLNIIYNDILDYSTFKQVQINIQLPINIYDMFYNIYDSPLTWSICDDIYRLRDLYNSPCNIIITGENNISYIIYKLNINQNHEPLCIFKYIINNNTNEKTIINLICTYNTFTGTVLGYTYCTIQYTLLQYNTIPISTKEIDEICQ